MNSVAEAEYKHLNPEFLEEASMATYRSMSYHKSLTQEKLIMNMVEKIKIITIQHIALKTMIITNVAY